MQEDGIVLSQGLGLNQQELEMRSILVRVQQELLKAAVHTRQQQETHSQEPLQVSSVQGEDLKSPPHNLAVGDECNQQGVKEKGGETVEVVEDQIGQEQKTAGVEQMVEQEDKPEEEQQAGPEEVEEDIVELENLMRVNFLVVADEVELLEVGDEVE